MSVGPVLVRLVHLDPPPFLLSFLQLLEYRRRVLTGPAHNNHIFSASLEQRSFRSLVDGVTGKSLCWRTFVVSTVLIMTRWKSREHSVTRLYPFPDLDVLPRHTDGDCSCLCSANCQILARFFSHSQLFCIVIAVTPTSGSKNGALC